MRDYSKAEDVTFISIAFIEHRIIEEYFRGSISHSTTFIVIVALHFFVGDESQTEIYDFRLHVSQRNYDIVWFYVTVDNVPRMALFYS